jgi:hypothetical protein
MFVHSSSTITGLDFFAAGAAGDRKPLCTVEAVAKRFPLFRVLPTGAQRLTLEEQRAFLENHWPELQIMFIWFSVLHCVYLVISSDAAGSWSIA